MVGAYPEVGKADPRPQILRIKVTKLKCRRMHVNFGFGLRRDANENHLHICILDSDCSFLRLSSTRSSLGFLVISCLSALFFTEEGSKRVEGIDGEGLKSIDWSSHISEDRRKA